MGSLESERRRREAERRRKAEEARRRAIEIARKIRLAKEAARRKRINARNHSANVHTNHLNNRYKWYVNLRTRFARHIRAYYQRFLNWANNKFNWAKYHMRRQHDANRVRQVFNKVWNPVHQQWGRVWKHAHHLRRQRIHHRNRRANINKIHLRNRQRWYYSLARRLRHGGSKQHYNKFLRYMIGKFNWARHHMPRQWDSRGVNHIFHRIWSPVHRVWGRYWRHSNNLQRNWLRRRRRNKNFMIHFRNGRNIRLRTWRNNYVQMHSNGRHVKQGGAGAWEIFYIKRLPRFGYNCIALFGRHKRYLRARNNRRTIDQSGRRPHWNSFPMGWQWERFWVEPVGRGEYALRTRHNTYLRAHSNGWMDQSGYVRRGRRLPRNWRWERFRPQWI